MRALIFAQRICWGYTGVLFVPGQLFAGHTITSRRYLSDHLCHVERCQSKNTISTAINSVLVDTKF